MIGTRIGKDALGRAADEVLYSRCAEWCNRTQKGVIMDTGSYFEVVGIEKKDESEQWLEIPAETRLSKEFLYENLSYRFIDDNPESGLDLQRPLIEIADERLTCDESLKRMAYYLGDDDDISMRST